MLTVAHLITGLQTGGAESMLSRLACNIDRSKFRTIVISMTSGGQFRESLERHGVPFFSLDMPRGVADPRGLFRFLNLLKEHRPTILQTWLYHADLMGTLARLLGAAPHVIWNLRCSDMNMPDYRWLSRSLPLALARLSATPDAVVVNSKAGQAIHEEYGYQPRSWELIPNGFDLARFRPDPEARASVRRSLNIPDDVCLIGLPARLDPMKDHCSFLAAAQSVAARNERVRFALIGRGLEWENPRVARLVKAAGLSDKVLLLGERRNIEQIYSALDIATLSSAFGEGFPNVLGEAMACGIPCVATNVGDAAMIVGDTGLIVPPRDPSALAVAWQQMLSLGPEARANRGEAARQRISSTFSLPDIIARYQALYEKIGSTPTTMAMRSPCAALKSEIT